MPLSGKLETRPRYAIFYALVIFIPAFIFFYFSVNFPFLSELQAQPNRIHVRYSYERKNKPMPKCASQGRAKSFLIVFMGNSGSTAISTELLGHTMTHMEKLEFVSEYQGNSSAALSATRTFFEEGVRKGLTPGFKLRPVHIVSAPEEWQKLADEFETRIIWNYRKNVVKSTLTQYVKSVLHDDNGVGGLQTNISTEERCQVGKGCRYRVDVDKFHDMLNRGVLCNNEIITGVSLLDHGRGCVWEVPYEDYMWYRKETMVDIQRFLGFENEETQPTRYKGTKDNMCDVIENYDELCERLYGCVIFQQMLEDQANNCYCQNYTSGSGSLCDIRKFTS